jgi:hypothetical protein
VYVFPWRRKPPFHFLILLHQTVSRPFLQFMAANESRQAPIWIKHSARFCLCPDGVAVPEERWCCFMSNWFTFIMVAIYPAPTRSWLTLQAIRVLLQMVTANDVQFIFSGFGPALFSGSSSPSKLMQNSVPRQTASPPS